jgi:hypothetical protein
MCPRDRESSNAHTGADDSMDSAATTEEPLQRTTTDTGANDDASENVKPSVNASIYDPRWVEVTSRPHSRPLVCCLPQCTRFMHVAWRCGNSTDSF